jgi:regulator of sigma E protease
MEVIGNILLFLIILSVLVLIHELGHYLVAKKFGIKVEEFGYGFPPRAWGKRIGETLYSINWLPIGGFVKLYGEDEVGGGKVSGKSGQEQVKGKDISRAFFARSVPQRAAVVVAGVVMNLLLAFVIYYLFLAMSGFKTDLPLLEGTSRPKLLFVNQQQMTDVYITKVSKNSPAEKAGIKTQSRVLAINGEPILSSAAFSETIQKNKGKPITLRIEEFTKQNTTQQKTVSLTPRANPPKNEGALGIGFYPVDKEVLTYGTPAQRLASGVTHSVNMIIYQYEAIAGLIRKSFADRNANELARNVSGPIGIYAVVDTFSQIPDLRERFMQFLNLTALLSLSLAVFNILPIPALDGGRLFFILIEGITGRKVNQKFETLVHTIGMALLLGLIVLVTYKDFVQFILKR